MKATVEYGLRGAAFGRYLRINGRWYFQSSTGHIELDEGKMYEDRPYGAHREAEPEFQGEEIELPEENRE